MPEQPADYTHLLKLIASQQAEIRRIWTLLGNSPAATTSSLQSVTLTTDGGTGGSVTAAATFTYSFTDATNLAHTQVSPAHQRFKLALVATRGIYDSVKNALIWTDEIPVQVAACNQ